MKKLEYKTSINKYAMQNLNAYNRAVFEPEFRATETYRKLLNNYGSVSFDKFFEQKWEALTSRHKTTEVRVSATSWYYLNFLDSSKTIYDLGCGMNFFKPYFPNLIGVGAETDNLFYGDEYGFVDEDFYQNHKDYYDAVFSINSLNFCPLEEIGSIVQNFAAMVRPGGRGYLALNINSMRTRSTVYKDSSPALIDKFIRNQMADFSYEVLVFDLDLSVLHAWCDGNFRLVFSK